MKKILSLALAAVMTMSVLPVAYAAEGETVSAEQGTQVTYTAENLESYTITVPAKLAPGDTGTVTAKGTWPSTKNLRVTADESIEMVNSISTAANKELDITFEPIILAGSQTAEVSTTSDITVEDITDALFGTWSGIIHYNVDYAVMLGDVGNNYTLNAMDVTTIKRTLGNYPTNKCTTNEQLVAADVNQDGVVNETDGDIILKYANPGYTEEIKAQYPNIGTYISLANATVPTIEYYPNLVGDVTGDGEVNLFDIQRVRGVLSQNIAADEIKLVVADANGDKVINQTDVDMISAYSVGKTVDGSIVGQYRQDIDNSEYTIEYTEAE